MTPSDKGRSDIRPGQHPFTSTGRVLGGDETYGVYGAKGYYKTFQPQFKGRPLRHTEMDFNIDMIGQVIKGYRIVGSSLEPDEIDLVADLDKVLMFAERDMEDAEGNIVYEEDGITPKVEYVWELSSLGDIAGAKGDVGPTGAQGASGTNGAQGATGAQGLTGLTGVKGEVGSIGAQGSAGTAAQSMIAYKFLHDTRTPNATPLSPTLATFFEMNGAFVFAFKDNSFTDQKNKFLGLFASGSFDITIISQSGGSAVYTHYIFTDVYVDFTTFLGSDCVVIYALTVDGRDASNPDIHATGDISYNGSFPLDITSTSNVFIDKWNVGGGVGGGAQGAAGIDGAQGAAGIDGAQGATGPSGGIDGAQGAAGAQGATGAQGADGTNGTNGAQGADGTNGAQGDIGPTGAQGSSGLSGSNSKFLTLVVVPNNLDFEGATLNNQFIAVPAEVAALKLTGITASWGATIANESVDFSVNFTDALGIETTLHTYNHAAITKMYSEALNLPISGEGIITIGCPTPPAAGPQGYTVTLKFG